ncbi:MAG: threonine synthase [Flavisolibacter sp.]
MLYYSTQNKNLRSDFKEATIKGQPEDRGLYFPTTIPLLSKNFFSEIGSASKESIALKIIEPYVGDTIPSDDLERIVCETVNFDFPLVDIEPSVSVLELFHGPTLAFKDVGARFMSRCLGYFARDSKRKITVLVATSGDTGGAVASAFHGVQGVDVVVLYPSGKVSGVQELQLTTFGDNIQALEVEGKFDDCQQMVKAAFADRDLNQTLFLTSANSINIARWLPQQFYYFFAWQQWKNKQHPPVISVPSGNFGNICAGLLAFRSGLPVKHFIAACNANDIVPRYLQNGKYHARSAVATMSNAMDVGDPSNFVRILQLFDEQFAPLKNMMSGYSITDQETKDLIAQVYSDHGYVLDPHGAVGFAALKKYQQEQADSPGIILETAHPIKFYDVVEPLVHKKLPFPASVEKLLHRKKESIRMKAGLQELKEFLLST